MFFFTLGGGGGQICVALILKFLNTPLRTMKQTCIELYVSICSFPRDMQRMKFRALVVRHRWSFTAFAVRRTTAMQSEPENMLRTRGQGRRGRPQCDHIVGWTDTVHGALAGLLLRRHSDRATGHSYDILISRGVATRNGHRENC